MAGQLIHVVRHAHAGDPGAWMLDDDLRPLSEQGIGQASRLVARLSSPAPQFVYASPSLRCMATVLPLARRLGIPVCTLAELYEGAGAARMLERLAADSPAVVVACTHGDVLEDLIRLLQDGGLAPGSAQAKKGSTWTLGVVAGRVTSARYAPPP